MTKTQSMPEFTLRAFRYHGEADDGGFTATLMFSDQEVAELECKDVVAGDLEVAPMNQHYWQQFQQLAGAGADTQSEESTMEVLLDMADAAYHARRLQIVSLRHTAYRLKGDPPRAFRYLRGRPYTPEIDGLLKLTYGRRLESIISR